MRVLRRGFLGRIALVILCFGCKTTNDQGRAKGIEAAKLNRFGFEAKSGYKGGHDYIDIWVGKVKDYPAMRILTTTEIDLYVAKAKRVNNNTEAKTACQKELGDDWHLPTIYEYLAFLVNGDTQVLFPQKGGMHVINKDRVDIPVWLLEEEQIKYEKLLKTDQFFLIGEGFSEEYVSLSRTISDLKKTMEDPKNVMTLHDKGNVMELIRDLKKGIAVLCFAGKIPQDF